MKGIWQVLVYLLIIYLTVQISGIIFLLIGLVEGRSYILGWVTGALATIIILIILILAYLGEDGKRIVEALISRLL